MPKRGGPILILYLVRVVLQLYLVRVHLHTALPYCSYHSVYPFQGLARYALRLYKKPEPSLISPGYYIDLFNRKGCEIGKLRTMKGLLYRRAEGTPISRKIASLCTVNIIDGCQSMAIMVLELHFPVSFMYPVFF